MQPLERHFRIVQKNGLLLGYDSKDRQVGFGGDDKAGVYICLELLDRFSDLAVVFFAAEEIGCRGAFSVDAAVFDDIGYVLEFDCPARDMFSYTSSGIRLFDNNGQFIKTGLPVLNKWGVNKWQHHPFTDVMALRKRFSFSCMNLSSGYYNWHNSNECVKIEDTANSLEMATELVAALGNARYDYVHDAKLDESQAAGRRDGVDLSDSLTLLYYSGPNWLWVIPALGVNSCSILGRFLPFPFLNLACFSSSSGL